MCVLMCMYVHSFLSCTSFKGVLTTGPGNELMQGVKDNGLAESGRLC